MKKLLTFTSISMFCLTVLVVPLFFIILSFNNSHVNQAPNNNINNSNGDISKSNQGFNDLNTMDENGEVTKNLGIINLSGKSEITADIADQFLKMNNSNDKIFSLNTEDIYIKSVFLSNARITLEGFVGFVDVTYTLKNLDKLIDNIDIGNINKLDDSSIFDKFKSMNKKFLNVDLPSIFSIEYNDLKSSYLVFNSGGKPTGRSDNNKITINYKISNLDSLILVKNIGDVSTIKHEDIVNKVITANQKNQNIAIIEKFKNSFSVKSDNSSYNSATLLLNTNDLEVNYSDLSFKIDNLNCLIDTSSLGYLNNINKTEIVNKVVEMNPLLKSYLSDNKDEALEVTEYHLKSAKFKLKNNIKLSQEISVNYDCKTLSGIIQTNKLGDIEEYNKYNPNTQIVENTKKSNFLLDEINDNNRFIVSNINYENFTSSQQRVASSYNLTISGYEGSVNLNYGVKRKNVSDVIKNKNLGSFYWTNKQEVIDRISTSLDLNNVYVNSLTYDSVEIKAKEDSLKFYDSVNVSFKTDFNNRGTKTDISTVANAVRNSSTEVITKSHIQDSSTFGTHYINDSGGEQKFNFNYIVPLSISTLYYYKSNSYLRLFAKITLSKLASTGSVENTGTSIGGSTSSILDIPISTINSLSSNGNPWTGEIDTGGKFNNQRVGFRTRSWGMCNKSDTLGITSRFEVNVRKNSVDGDNQSLIFSFTVSNSMSDWSTCDSFDTWYKFTIYGISVESK
ncbi:hypothetical protein SCORR_v1c07860 [Spiroplasma corruscae]|uniref:Uncharacterized protein n=1 Tax=Spiroplasma corruscae TaxID=216934 RepID=A0A222EPU4_9MOLU|nr:hypothetical protein [Spiroplasma corruscae]ASP28558.1 hypothetical protein SCORR_v1c07860 [Spiroplasma corruscae]